ncbi:MAG TPA: hypothetical protein PLT92_02710 [Ignavibacteriaceae bacterium]|mgnify:CR=1 FL=1|nr:hypothetical protein [Ignavibacteriaceae bacterium]HPO54744.1 hypothetical protein [Ignavibacteriaceae bacterium]
MKIWTLIFVLLIGISINAQDAWLYVIKIKGKVVNSQNNKTIKPGDKLKPTDKLKFKDSTAVVRVLNPSEGIYNLSPNYSKEGKSNELQYLVKAIMSPILGSTTAVIYKKSVDFDLSFTEDELGDCTVFFGTQQLFLYPPLREEDDIFMEINIKDKIQTLPIKADNEILLLFAQIDSLISAEDIPCGELPVKLIRKNTDTTLVIHKFILIIPEKEALVKEINTTVSVLQKNKKDEEDIGWVIGQVIKANYPGCKFSWEPLNKWLKANTIYKVGEY